VGAEMTQTLYAHINKKKCFIKCMTASPSEEHLFSFVIEKLVSVKIYG
jgi:hypothetical protein